MSVKALFGLVISYVVLGLIIVSLIFGVVIAVQRGQINNGDLYDKVDDLENTVQSYRVKVRARDAILQRIKNALVFKRTALEKIDAQINNWEILKEAEKGGPIEDERPEVTE